MFVKVKDNLNFIIKKTPAKLKTPVLDLRTPRKQGFHTSNGKKVTILQINIEDRVTFLLLTVRISAFTALFNFINQWPTKSLRTKKEDCHFIPREVLPVPLLEHASWPNQSESLDHLFGHRCAFLQPLTWIPVRR